MHADGVDLWLMAFGIIGSVGDGFGTPLVLYISSLLMNNIGGASTSFAESFQRNINKVLYSFSLKSIRIMLQAQ
jgi:ATP-binding cassette subfamily B (MDR/TAP) protein 1